MIKLGFIGVGNMGGSILSGVLSKKVLPENNIFVFDTNPELLTKTSTGSGFNIAKSNTALCAQCDMVLLAVKPNVCESVLGECSAFLQNKALISIVTGWSRPRLAAIIPNTRILRVMPNTPCLVGEGMSVFDSDHTLFEAEYNLAAQIFSSIGKLETVQPQLMSAITGISGSGPAYVYMFIEALADGGVRVGLPRKTAYTLAAQTVLGSAKMVLETGIHPGQLKDNICTPGGTTIEAIAVLEQAGLRAAVIDAVTACANKADEMSGRS